MRSGWESGVSSAISTHVADVGSDLRRKNHDRAHCAESRDIDGNASTAQRETLSWQSAAYPSLPQDAGDLDHVRTRQRDGDKTGDGVGANRGAKVDTCEHQCRCDNCPKGALRYRSVWNLYTRLFVLSTTEGMAGWTHLSQLVGQWQPVVSRKSPNLSARCRCLANLTRHEAHHDRHKHGDSANFALRRVVEDWHTCCLLENGSSQTSPAVPRARPVFYGATQRTAQYCGHSVRNFAKSDS